MTPSKEKKPLPPSSSPNMTVVVLDKPSTYLQWHTALQQVKVLYLKRQYKQCASRCTQLLSTAPIEKIHPLHHPFLYFYTALSHEAVARSAHNLSAAKLGTLHVARSAYEAAASSLPRPATRAVTADDDDDDYYYEEGDASSTRSFSDTASLYSVTSSHTPNDNNDDDDDDENERPTPRHSTTRPPPPGCPASPSPQPSPTSTAALRPSPLRIRKKTVHFPPTPPRSHPSPPPSSPTHSTPSAAAYNTHLISFATTLQTRIHAVETLLHRTDVAQRNGRRGAGGDVDGQGEGREARIARLRAGGWRRERFVAGRYEEVCARALAEL